MRVKLVGFVLAGLMSAQMSFAALSPYADQEVKNAVDRAAQIQKQYARGEITQQQRDLLIDMNDNAIETVALSAAGLKGIELEDKWFMTEARAHQIMDETQAEVLARYSEGKEAVLHGVERTD